MVALVYYVTNFGDHASTQNYWAVSCVPISQHVLFFNIYTLGTVTEKHFSKPLERNVV